MKTITITTEDFMSLLPQLDSIPTTERIHVVGIDVDAYTVRKVVGYLENLGFKVTWKETYTDKTIVLTQLTGN